MVSSSAMPATLHTGEGSNAQQNAPNDNMPDEGTNPASFAEALKANSPFNDERLFYSGMIQSLGLFRKASLISQGDRQGVVHSVMEICSGQQSTAGRAFWFHMSPADAKKIWETHDWVYLQSKGVFDLPSIDVCDSLIRSYFEHVHPLLPIIDAGHFLSQYTLRGASSMNLLLLWSVFFAAANVWHRISQRPLRAN